MRKTFLLLFASALSFVSCNKEGEIFGDGNDQDVAETLLTRSAEDASDPFAVDAMQRALDMLAADNPEITPVQLRPTHYYVKFNPHDSVQMDKLEDVALSCSTIRWITRFIWRPNRKR